VAQPPLAVEDVAARGSRRLQPAGRVVANPDEVVERNELGRLRFLERFLEMRNRLVPFVFGHRTDALLERLPDRELGMLQAVKIRLQFINNPVNYFIDDLWRNSWWLRFLSKKFFPQLGQRESGCVPKYSCYYLYNDNRREYFLDYPFIFCHLLCSYTQRLQRVKDF